MNSLPIDQPERDRAAHDLDTTFLVEASAGTGKTTLAIRRILHAVRLGRAKMEEVGAITFTEKAAGELKIRLRNDLERERRGASGAERERFERAVRELERSHINTIHGFCSWLLKERPIEAGVDPNFQVLDELETQLLREEVWEEWFDQQMESRPEVLKRALYAELSPDMIRALAFEIVDKRDRVSLDLLQASRYSVADGVAELRAILAPLKPKLANCNDHSDNGYAQIDGLLQLVQRLDSLPPHRQEFDLLHSVHVKKNAGNQLNWDDPDSLKAIKSAYDGIEAIPLKRGAALLQDLSAWLKEFLGALERAKAARAVLDFDDLLLRACGLLQRDRTVRADLQRRFQFLLVDEFQDTDPVQTEIVFFLAEDGANATRWMETRLKPGKLFLVGDPKQSIYRFRRADIETYEAAKQLVQSQGEVLTIRQSFRTVSSLLGWVDLTFEQLIHKPADGGSYQPDYVRLHPSPARHIGEPRVCVLEPTPEQSRALEEDRHVDTLRAMEASEVARWIQHLVTSDEWKVQERDDREPRPARYRDFAVLLHSPATSLAHYELAFQDRGIPYQVEGGKDYFQSPEIRAVCALLLALDDPMDARELVGVLRSAVFGFSDEEIFLWAKDRPLDYLGATNHESGITNHSIAAAFALLRRLHEQRNAHTFAGFLELIYRELKLPELFSLHTHGEQRVANLMKLLAVARRVQAAGILSLRAFVHYLRTTALDRSEEGQSPNAEAQDDVVSLMSIHKAKGLEWSIVVAGDLGGSKHSHHSLLLTTREGSDVAFRLGKDRRTENYESLFQQEKVRQEAEELRLLYVAATRARDYLVLPWFAKKGHYLDKLKVAFDPANPGEALPMFFRVNASQCPGEVPRRAPIRVELDEPDAAQRPGIERLVAQRVEWMSARAAIVGAANAGRQRATPSRLAQEKDETAERRISESADAKRAALFGTTMHEVLATMDFSKPDETEVLWRQRAAVAGLSEEDTKRGLATLQRFLQGDLCRRIRQSLETCREMPFACVRDGLLVEGTIDLLFRERDQWVLVDYKTDRIAEADVAARAERYRPQADAYAESLETVGGIRPAKILVFLDPGSEVRLP